MTADAFTERRRAACLSDVDSKRRQAETAGEALRAAIVGAVAAGCSHAEVAARANLTRSRVSQIVREDRAMKGRQS